MDGAGPLPGLWLRWRKLRGKEMPERLDERHGVPGAPRPPGKLVWVHAASLGEMLSVLALMRRLLQSDEDVTILLSTVTVSSARVIAERIARASPDDPIAARLIHQFLPLDRTAAVTGFLDHWRPDAVIWVESEFWPTLLRHVSARGIPLTLLNGRLSERSFGRWRLVRGWISKLLAGFDPLLAQSETDRRRLVTLGAEQADYLGNLKLSGEPLAADAHESDELRSLLADRPRWLLASSHPGEEAVAFRAHRALLKDRMDFLTLIAPRHPERADAIEQLALREGFMPGRRSRGERPEPWQDIYIVDTLGELGLFYRHCPVACIGGSLVRHGGHNPYEPVQLGCCVLHGPHMDNFAELTAALDHVGAARLCESSEELVTAIGVLVDNEDSAAVMRKAAEDFVAEQSGVLDRITARLAPTLERAGIKLS